MENLGIKQRVGNQLPTLLIPIVYRQYESKLTHLQRILFYLSFSVIIMVYASCITRIKSIPLK